MPEPPGESTYRVLIVAPVYCDWDSAALLCGDLDARCLGIAGLEVQVLFVDGGSPPGIFGWKPHAFASIRSVDVLYLSRNLGHQRAIAIALCHAHATLEFEAVLVMDADGEDQAADAIQLVELARQGKPRIIFAERRRRIENLPFRIGYFLYRVLHYVLTGIPVRVGNFSIVPRRDLKRLVCMSELWNHYVGAIFRSKLAFDLHPTTRGRRYAGRSHMNLISLANHGLSGIASFQDVVATRILMATLFAVSLVLATIAVVVVIRLMTRWAVPGWATYSVGLLLVLLSQLAATAFGLVFTLITSRNNVLFVPIRDYEIFIDRLERLWTYDSRMPDGTVESHGAADSTPPR